MPDLEKVKKALECCMRENNTICLCGECPYHTESTMFGCMQNVMRDALALLREQEPRVLEYSEIEKHPLVWLEDNDKEDVIPALFLQYNGWNAEFAVQDPDEYVSTCVRSATVYAVKNVYGVMWRAWTSRPSPEQMRDTPWEGDNDAE